jgi:menaquinone reductase, multiheme cytochrome c subunit
MRRPLFPRWANRTRVLLGALLGTLPAYAVGLWAYAASPRTSDVGHMPAQPVPNSHALHVGQLGIDCRFCHHSVDRAAHAALPGAATCQICHRTVRVTSAKLGPVRRSATTGGALQWTRVNHLPDFVFFDHRAHVTSGVACVSCHGAVDHMEQTWQTETLSMAFCLDCHRRPEAGLRPLDRVTAPSYEPPADPVAFGRELGRRYGVQPSTDCSACHR